MRRQIFHSMRSCHDCNHYLTLQSKEFDHTRNNEISHLPNYEKYVYILFHLQVQSAFEAIFITLTSHSLLLNAVFVDEKMHT